MVLIAAVMDSG